MKHIIGDSGKRKYNRNLGKQVNEEWERAQAKEELDKKLREERSVNVVEELLRRYREYTQNFGGAIIHDPEDFNFSDLNYNAADIFEFSKQLKEDKGNGAIFLSGLIAGCQGENFGLSMQGFNNNGIKPDRIGYRLRNDLEVKKHLEIRGDVGDLLGHHTKGFDIVLEGNAGNYIGRGAENCDIFLRGTAEGLSDNNHIGKGTNIYISIKTAPGYHKLYPK